VSAHFRISLSSLKRWIQLTRRGECDFPLSISPKGYKLRFRREDIENWQSRVGNISPQADILLKESRHNKKKGAKK